MRTPPEPAAAKAVDATAGVDRKRNSTERKALLGQIRTAGLYGTWVASASDESLGASLAAGKRLIGGVEVGARGWKA